MFSLIFQIVVANGDIIRQHRPVGCDEFNGRFAGDFDGQIMNTGDTTFFKKCRCIGDFKIGRNYTARV